jgi:hypothetical protein
MRKILLFIGVTTVFAWSYAQSSRLYVAQILIGQQALPQLTPTTHLTHVSAQAPRVRSSHR